mgnify:CR=1 FL=1
MHYAVERKVSEMMKWLVELRGERSQQMVADEIGMSQSGYASIETGARRPSVSSLSGLPQLWASIGPSSTRTTRISAAREKAPSLTGRGTKGGEQRWTGKSKGLRCPHFGGM